MRWFFLPCIASRLEAIATRSKDATGWSLSQVGTLNAQRIEGTAEGILLLRLFASCYPRSGSGQDASLWPVRGSGRVNSPKTPKSCFALPLHHHAFVLVEGGEMKRIGINSTRVAVLVAYL